MRKFITVLKFELKEYLGNKTFMVLTAILAILGVALLFLPRFVDMSGMTGVTVVGGGSAETETTPEEEQELFLYLDKAGVVQTDILEQIFPEAEWQTAADETEIRTAVEAQEAKAGFVVTAPAEYEYYVFNKTMSDQNTARFDQAMKIFYRMDYCAKSGWNLEEITAMYDVPVTVTENVLNKDTESNYWYSYFLIILVFMLIVYYGQMIAVSVTNEKSNRAIEVLVTSTSPNSLLFGKVIAGAIAGVFQMGVLLGAVLIAYQVNREQWGGMLDRILYIPGDVLLAFAFFGLGGYLFYAFLYGAMGALVSKTEDISKSVSGLMVVIMAVYCFSLFQLTNIDGSVIKILSFLPISSYSTMFARIAMGTVAAWEVIVSFLILAGSIGAAGIVGAKIYRMGTLRYGNPIKITTALKALKKNA
nr:ABC transporter permease [uncultured Acetatifactor sp.]